MANFGLLRDRSMLGSRMRSSITVLVFESFLNSLDPLFSSIIPLGGTVPAARMRSVISVLVLSDF